MMCTLSSPQSSEELSRALMALEDMPKYGVASRDEVEQLERAAETSQDSELVWRARLLSAELAGRRGELAEAMRVLQQINEVAAANGHTRLLARSHLIIGWTYRDAGDAANYLEHAVKAVELLDEDAPSSVRALHLMRLADALDECGSPEEARLRYAQSEEVAIRGGHVDRQVSCLNNRAYAEYRSGDLVAAEATISRLVEVCRAHQEPMRHNTLDTIARIQIALGQPADAIETMREAMEVYQAHEGVEAMTLAEFLLTLAVAHRHVGGLDEAQRNLDECRSIATAAGLFSVLASVEEEQAELHAACGDFVSAFHRFKAFHAAEKDLLFERRAAQSKLRQAILETNEVRAEADRLQRLDGYRMQMIATISHELMNPLTAVTGHLELMTSLPDLPPAGVHSLSVMQRGADRLWALTNSLLELTRLQQGEDPPRQDRVDLDDVLAGAVDLLDVVAAGEDVSIDHRRAQEPVLVLGDADELHRALVNLVSNAVKYSNPGDTVTVQVERVADEVVFSCVDDGLGISRKDQDRLFTEFFRSTNAEALGRPGTGLGLAIVQHIATRHRGRVEVSSELGAGSIFALHLPAAASLAG